MDWMLSYAPADESQFAGFQARLLSRESVERLEWKPVSVPSSVQHTAWGLPLSELYMLDNIHQVEWMRGKYWIYRTSVTAPAVGVDEEAVIQFKGVDYECAVYLDGVKRTEHEGMFSPFEVPLANLLPGSEHDLVVAIAPFEAGDEPYEHMKSRYSIGKGWDFSPKILPVGIWDEVFIEVRKKLRVVDAYVKTVLANQQRADTMITIKLSEFVDYGTIMVSLDGVTRSFPVVQTDRLLLPLNIPSPTLWWPNGYGNADLVTLAINLQVAGQDIAPFTRRTGLCAIRRVPCVGQGVEDIPLQLEINNQKVFIKGVNWTPLDACPGSITKERYSMFLEQFKEGGVNFVRVWGGGLKEKADFYSFADELGLMVMQEFPLACQRLARTEKFYRLIVQEISSIIESLRHHPCIVIWSGGNEHYHYWDSVDSGTPIMERAKPVVQKLFDIVEGDDEWHGFADGYDEPSLGLIGHLCATLDGSRPYQITSAMEREGEVHGIWNWNPRIGDHRYRDYASLYDFWNKADQHFYSEGCTHAIANLETIRAVFGTEYPPYPEQHDPIWQLHQAFKAAWDEYVDLWLDLPSTERLFGKLDSLEDLVFANQWMQGEGGRYLVEAIRRKMDRTCGIVWWGVNEPWPELAGNALIDYFGRPKLGWRFVTNSFKPTILTLHYAHCVARSVKPQLWLTHDRHEPFEGRYLVTITNLTSLAKATVHGQIQCPGYTSTYIRTLSRTRMLPGTRLHIQCQLFDKDGAHCIHLNDYVFGSNEDEVPFDTPMLQFMKSVFASKGLSRAVS